MMFSFITGSRTLSRVTVSGLSLNSLYNGGISTSHLQHSSASRSVALEESCCIIGAAARKPTCARGKISRGDLGRAGPRRGPARGPRAGRGALADARSPHPPTRPGVRLSGHRANILQVNLDRRGERGRILGRQHLPDDRRMQIAALPQSGDAGRGPITGHGREEPARGLRII